MNDALQVFVRGFETQECGNVVMDCLTDLGFEIEGAFDGTSDSLGGMVETNVAYQDTLTQNDPSMILDELRKRTGLDALWVETREFKLTDEGVYGREQGDETEDE